MVERMASTSIVDSLFATPAAQARLERFFIPVEPGSRKLRTWLHTDSYSLWTACEPAAAEPYVLWRVHGSGVMRVPMEDTILHRVPPGLAHHIAGLFGYWRTGQADTFFMCALRGEHVHYAVITSPSSASEAISWICPKCACEVRSETAGGTRGIAWLDDGEAVNRFNADESRRLCPSCGHIHPMAYSFGGQPPAGVPTW